MTSSCTERRSQQSRWLLSALGGPAQLHQRRKNVRNAAARSSAAAEFLGQLPPGHLSGMALIGSSLLGSSADVHRVRMGFIMSVA